MTPLLRRHKRHLEELVQRLIVQVRFIERPLGLEEQRKPDAGYYLQARFSFFERRNHERCRINVLI